MVNFRLRYCRKSARINFAKLKKDPVISISDYLANFMDNPAFNLADEATAAKSLPSRSACDLCSKFAVFICIIGR